MERIYITNLLTVLALAIFIYIVYRIGKRIDIWMEWMEKQECAVCQEKKDECICSNGFKFK